MKMKYLAYIIPACIMVNAASAMKFEIDTTELPQDCYSVHITYSEQTGTKQTLRGLEPEYANYEERIHLKPRSTITGDFFTRAPEKSFDKVGLCIYSEGPSALLMYSSRKLNVKGGKIDAKIILKDNLPYIEDK